MGFEYGYPWRRPRRWSVGEVSSATSPTARRRSSTSSSPRASEVDAEVGRRAAAPHGTRDKVRPLQRPHRALAPALLRGRPRRVPAVDPGELLPPAPHHAYVNWHRPVVSSRRSRCCGTSSRCPCPRDHRQQLAAGNGRPDDTDPSAVTRLVLCSGKIRWELVSAREKYGLQGQVAIIPLERLYPLPTKSSRRSSTATATSPTIRYAQTSRRTRVPGGTWSANLAAAIRTCCRTTTSS